MKNFKYILTLVVIVFLGVIISKNWQFAKEMSNNGLNNPNLSNSSEPIQICYIWNTEAGDSASLHLDITEGTNITGFFNWRPFEKDSKTGKIIGLAGPLDQKTMSRTAYLVWSATSEGVTNDEELSIIFGEGIANPGFGEMMQNEKGLYIYADPENISYDITLAQTDCSDSAIK